MTASRHRIEPRLEPVNDWQGSTPGRALVRTGGVANDVAVIRDPGGATAERMHALATRLMVGPRAEYARTFAIVSPDRGDGRSFVAANLAAVFARSGRRTLLVDADFRNPVQHTLFRCPRGPGLAGLIRSEAELESIEPVDGVPGLYVMAAGESAEGELALLTRPHLGDLLNQFRVMVDQIVIDTPAGTTGAAAQAVAARAGAALLLARRDRSRLAHMERLVATTRESGAEVIGTVINRR